MIRTCPVIAKFGTKMHQISEHVFRIIRGEVVTIEGLTFFCTGDARSTDKGLRTESIGWWPEEDIAEDDYQNTKKNLDRYNWHVDYVLSRCCPENVDQFMLKHCYSDDINTQYLYVFYKNLYLKEWFFGALS